MVGIEGEWSPRATTTTLVQFPCSDFITGVSVVIEETWIKWMMVSLKWTKVIFIRVILDFQSIPHLPLIFSIPYQTYYMHILDPITFNNHNP